MLSDSFIFDMVHTLPYASFKDASTGKYILANHEIAGCWNLSPEQMVGLTVGDLGPGTSIADLGLVKSRLRKAHAVQTQEMDRWVREQRSGTTTTRIVR